MNWIQMGARGATFWVHLRNGREWRVQPNGGGRWIVVGPDGTAIEGTWRTAVDAKKACGEWLRNAAEMAAALSEEKA